MPREIVYPFAALGALPFDALGGFADFLDSQSALAATAFLATLAFFFFRAAAAAARAFSDHTISVVSLSFSRYCGGTERPEV